MSLNQLRLLVLAAAISASEPVPIIVDVDLRVLAGSPTALGVLRSSSFFVPKTRTGYDSYLAMPGGHHATRINIFEQALADSQDESSFLANLERHRDPLARLCRTTDRLVIVISKMPPWLSRLPNAMDSIGDAGWRRVHAQPPRDQATWERIVAAGARWFSGFPGPRRDYEVWNEPDLFSWKASADDYLRFYEATALCVRRADPQALVGGAALNGWGGTILGDGGGDLNRQLIRLAGDRQVPLDFISWHWFSSDPDDITAAASDYRAASRAARLQPAPRLQVTEWNVSAELRGTAWTAALHAEAFSRFLGAGVEAQMVATWEDFLPRPSGLDDYGLITQQGQRKPVWYVHDWFDALARDAAGWAVIRTGTLRLIVTRVQTGWRLVCWDPSPEPGMAALAVLRKNFTLNELATAYGDAATLLAWVNRGKSKDGGHNQIFADARDARMTAISEAGQRRLYQLRIFGLPQGSNIKSQAVKEVVRTLPLEANGTGLSFLLERNEVMRLDIGP